MLTFLSVTSSSSCRWLLSRCFNSVENSIDVQAKMLTLRQSYLEEVSPNQKQGLNENGSAGAPRLNSKISRLSSVAAASVILSRISCDLSQHASASRKRLKGRNELY